MGETRVSIRVYGALGSTEVQTLVDTGATFSKIPRAIIDELGLEARYETPVELGDGRVITRQLALAEIEISGVRRPVLLAISEETETPLLGCTSLETLGFKVNPITSELEKTNPIEY